jgi:hypothetical protein
MHQLTEADRARDLSADLRRCWAWGSNHRIPSHASRFAALGEAACRRAIAAEAALRELVAAAEAWRAAREAEGQLAADMALARATEAARQVLGP